MEPFVRTLLVSAVLCVGHFAGAEVCVCSEEGHCSDAETVVSGELAVVSGWWLLWGLGW